MIPKIPTLKTNAASALSNKVISITVFNESVNAESGIPIFSLFKAEVDVVSVKSTYPMLSYEEIVWFIQKETMYPIGIMLQGSAVAKHSNIVPIKVIHQNIFGGSIEAVYNFEGDQALAQPNIILHSFTDEYANMFRIGMFSRYEIIKMPAKSELILSLYF